MRRVPPALAVVLLAASGVDAQTAGGPPLTATFIGNMAVHITDGRTALLTDFPYEAGYSGYMRWSPADVPKGPRPLCLITHSHRDHFFAPLAAETCGQILGPRDVTGSPSTRVPALPLAAEVKWSGLAIRPTATPHAGIEHYSYIVEWAGLRLYFSGDTEDTQALLAVRGLDVAFVSPWLLRSVQRQGARIDARRVVVYHHRVGETVPPIQDRIVPTQGQVLVLERPPG